MDKILSLIEDIYEAGARPEHWHTALTNIADATGSYDATMGGQTGNLVPLMITARTDMAQVRTYAEHYHARNAMQRAMVGQPIGRFVLDSTLVDESFYRSEFFNDWCKPQGFLRGAAINLAADEGWRATLMVSGPRQYERQAQDILQILAPHLRRAFELNQMLHDARSLSVGAMAALEYLERGVLLVDRQGHAQPVNTMAQRILSLGDGLSLRDGVLGCSVLGETAALERALTNCVRGGVTASGGKLQVTRSAGRSKLEVQCVPFPAGRWWPGFEQQAAIVFVTDRDARMAGRTARLRARFGLTPAEAALALEIARSGGRADAAANRGVSVSTARTQLSSIFDKTGVRRQTELVRLLLETLDDPD